MTPKQQKLDPATLTADELRAVLDYDPQTGALTWRSRPREDFQFEHAFERFNADRAGRQAGKRSPKGTIITFKATQFPAEQLAWLHANGVWPTGDIEFVDGEPNNYALANLREGDLPFAAGTGGAAHKRRVKAPRNLAARAVAPQSCADSRVAAQPSDSVMAQAAAHLAAKGMGQGDRRRLLREVGDLL